MYQDWEVGCRNVFLWATEGRKHVFERPVLCVYIFLSLTIIGLVYLNYCFWFFFPPKTGQRTEMWQWWFSPWCLHLHHITQGLCYCFRSFCFIKLFFLLVWLYLFCGRALGMPRICHQFWKLCLRWNHVVNWFLIELDLLQWSMHY